MSYPFTPGVDATHRRVVIRVTARQMWRLKSIVQEVSEELATWPYIRLVGCEISRWHDHTMRSDLLARLIYEIPPSAAGWVKVRDIEQRAYAWVESPVDLRGYENIRVMQSEYPHATPASSAV